MISAGVERDFAMADGLRIAYESSGSGRPALVLIPGSFEDRSYFAPLAARLASSRQVVAMDLRGQGESDAPDTVKLAEYERDVIAVMEAVAADGVVLCGHSASGAVALEVASARPDLVRGLAMIDGGIAFVPEAVHQQVASSLLPALVGPHWRDALKAFFERGIDAADPPEIRERVMADIDRWRPELARTFFADLYGDAFTARQAAHSDLLARLDCPVLYVHAKVPADLQKLQQLRPDLLLGQVVGSGHYVMLTAIDQLTAMLERFLEVVDRQP